MILSDVFARPTRVDTTMRNAAVHVMVACALLGATGMPARAQVFSSEFFSDPVSEGWSLVVQYCAPEIWTDQGWYQQQLDLDACPPGPSGGREVYRRSLETLNGVATFFVEFRVQADGDRSEIPYGAPALLAMGNNARVNYHITVARDLVKFFGDFYIPIFIDVAADVPHIYRLELRADRYAFHIDADLIDEGPPQGPFPAFTSKVLWQGQSWYLPCHNAWDYIRYGVIPVDGSGDYDSDGAVTLFDHYFIHDCLTKDGPGIFGGPNNNAGPGCRFADFDADADTDLLDFAEFQNLFTGQ